MTLSHSLQRRKASEWKEKVHLLFGDMRSLSVPEPADIIVSELLGSFGDNELSPECLDGAMRFLKRKSLSFSFVAMAQFHGLLISKWYLNPLIILCTYGAVVLFQTL